MPKMTISIPADVNVAIKEINAKAGIPCPTCDKLHRRVNWSGIAAAAFKKEMERLKFERL